MSRRFEASISLSTFSCRLSPSRTSSIALKNAATGRAHLCVLAIGASARSRSPVPKWERAAMREVPCRLRRNHMIVGRHNPNTFGLNRGCAPLHRSHLNGPTHPTPSFASTCRILLLRRCPAHPLALRQRLKHLLSRMASGCTAQACHSISPNQTPPRATDFPCVRRDSTLDWSRSQSISACHGNNRLGRFCLGEPTIGNRFGP